MFSLEKKFVMTFNFLDDGITYHCSLTEAYPESLQKGTLLGSYPALQF